MRYLADVYEFHNRFGIPQPFFPRPMDPEMAEFRLKFLKEELEEYEEALKSGDLEKQLDSLVDLVYVALGTALISGFDFHAAWERVHQANMLKKRVESADESGRGSSFDVVKPDGWTPPRLSDLVKRYHVRWIPDEFWGMRS